MKCAQILDLNNADYIHANKRILPYFHRVQYRVIDRQLYF